MAFSLGAKSMVKPTDASPRAEIVPERPVRLVVGKYAGRRSIVSFMVASVAVLSEAGDSRKSLLQEYLERSKKNKAKYDKERLDDYYKRNYKDYFDLVEGSVEGKNDEQLSEAEKGIRDWLLKNK